MCGTSYGTITSSGGTFSVGTNPAGTGTTLDPNREWAQWTMPDSPTSHCEEGICHLHGEDGDYQTPATAFSANPDGGFAVTIHAFIGTDTVTKLTWLLPEFAGGDLEPETATSESVAATYCGDFPGYQVPTAIELLSLLDMGVPAPAPMTRLSVDQGQPMVAAPYWTATPSGAGNYLTVDFSSGVYSAPSAMPTAYVICVEPPSSSAPSWTPLDAGSLRRDVASVFSDPRTKLDWAVVDPDGGLDWYGALAACNDLESLTCVDWRLPSYKELVTLVSFTGDTDAGPPTRLSEAWTSTATVSPLGSDGGDGEVFVPGMLGASPQLTDALTQTVSATYCVHNSGP